MPKPGGVATPHDRSRRRRRGADGDELVGRTQIIEAAIASILEVGFYRSSTNEIARRANVSWGALQYHFGTREALLLAIVQELDHRFQEDITNATVVGKNVEQRITSLYQVLSRHYDTPTSFVRLQVVLNLQHDPDTSDDVMAELTQNAAKSEVHVRRLLRDAIGAKATKADIDALFYALRGFAFSKQLSSVLAVEGSRPPGPDTVKRFLRGIAAGYAASDEAPKTK
jgi:AcrR family transcriptional regulator